MEVLVQWFTDNLSQFISAEMVIFYYFNGSDSGTERRTSGSFAFEDSGSDSHSHMYNRKYYTDSVLFFLFIRQIF